MSQGMCVWSLEAGKGKETDSPLEPLEGIRPCQHLDFSPVRTSLESDLQNYKTVSLCCFMPLSLRQRDTNEEKADVQQKRKGMRRGPLSDALHSCLIRNLAPVTLFCLQFFPLCWCFCPLTFKQAHISAVLKVSHIVPALWSPPVFSQLFYT